MVSSSEVKEGDQGITNRSRGRRHDKPSLETRNAQTNERKTSGKLAPNMAIAWSAARQAQPRNEKRSDQREEDEWKVSSQHGGVSYRCKYAGTVSQRVDDPLTRNLFRRVHKNCVLYLLIRLSTFVLRSLLRTSRVKFALNEVLLLNSLLWFDATTGHKVGVVSGRHFGIDYRIKKRTALDLDEMCWGARLQLAPTDKHKVKLQCYVRTALDLDEMCWGARLQLAPTDKHQVKLQCYVRTALDLDEMCWGPVCSSRRLTSTKTALDLDEMCWGARLQLAPTDKHQVKLQCYVRTALDLDEMCWGARLQLAPTDKHQVKLQCYVRTALDLDEMCWGARLQLAPTDKHQVKLQCYVRTALDLDEMCWGPVCSSRRLTSTK
ncbi:hypothetical protein J6590_047034 [Homalodisca vitripennis]|nr:hypothetical protein J6590_047034 [Homalodisca vitripennis]